MNDQLQAQTAQLLDALDTLNRNICIGILAIGATIIAMSICIIVVIRK
jgi:hypothetical protein